MEGFLRNFDDWQDAMQLTSKQAGLALRGALRDEAKRYEETVRYKGSITYSKVCKELQAAFGGAAERYYNDLVALKRGEKEDLADYNKKFSDLRARAGSYLDAFTAARAYISGLTPHQLQVQVYTSRPKNLQEAMQTASLLEPVLKSGPKSSSGG